jgi:hypothetical protein
MALQSGRPVGSDGRVQWRYAGLTTWVDGVAVRTTNYTDIDEARVAAERLARERGRRCHKRAHDDQLVVTLDG